MYANNMLRERFGFGKGIPGGAPDTSITCLPAHTHVDTLVRVIRNPYPYPDYLWCPCAWSLFAVRPRRPTAQCTYVIGFGLKGNPYPNPPPPLHWIRAVVDLHRYNSSHPIRFPVLSFGADRGAIVVGKSVMVHVFNRRRCRVHLRLSSANNNKCKVNSTTKYCS